MSNVDELTMPRMVDLEKRVAFLEAEHANGVNPHTPEKEFCCDSYREHYSLFESLVDDRPSTWCRFCPWCGAAVEKMKVGWSQTEHV